MVFILFVDETLLLVLLHRDFVYLDGAILAEIVGEIGRVSLEVAIFLKMTTVGAGRKIAKNVIVHLFDQKAPLGRSIAEFHIGSELGIELTCLRFTLEV